MDATHPPEGSERLLTLPDVLNRCNLSRSALYRLKKDGEFPECIRITQRTAFWKESEVERWIRELSSANNKPLAKPPPPGTRDRRGRRRN